ncbi:Zn(2+) transporter ZRC1 [Ascoidea rubescens DSM 1968]|uniref:Cation efflux protein n=1 Tax=Ascoidea rubescens DSM 1968 TaxID=1344418 RepID=A0A1D2VL44_9ASCO|nr:cation efflux protein [Ascoidea rubescens DSM 1968]ODV62319.1 cation efflux protein [Ascoidea rubescens DSM 1968]
MDGKQVRIVSLLILDTIFFLLEVIIGYAVNSLALIADSFHMLNDILSLFVALWAVKQKKKEATADYTYGWQRAEILGALINAVFLLALCFSILIEAIQRLISPQIITNPKLILYVGCAGLISNFVGLVLFNEHGHSHSHSSSSSKHSHSHANANNSSSVSHSSSENINEMLPETVVGRIDDERTSLLHSKNTQAQAHSHNHAHTKKHYHDNPHEHTDHDHSDHSDHEDLETQLVQQKPKKSLNMKGVFLHVLGDALGNVGVILTALFIWKTNYSWKYYFDPIISLVITAIIFSSALPLCKTSSKILLQATPNDISADDVQYDILNLSYVKSVHDFHIWNLTEDILIASLHVELDASPEKFFDICVQIKKILHKYGIHSATIQPEFKSLDFNTINSINPISKSSTIKSTSLKKSQSKLHSQPQPQSQSQSQSQPQTQTQTQTQSSNVSPNATLIAKSAPLDHSLSYGSVNNGSQQCLVDEETGCNSSDCLH